MGSHSKQKGAQFERDMCRKLSLWLSGGRRSDLFWRSAMSGGRATLAAKKGDDTVQSSGDLTAIDSTSYIFASKFSIECKFYKDFDFGALIYGRKSGLPVFWKQCRTDAKAVNKLPFLIAKKNNYPIVLFLDNGGKDYFFGFGADSSISSLLIKAGLRAKFYVDQTHATYLFLFDDFLETDFCLMIKRS